MRNFMKRMLTLVLSIAMVCTGVTITAPQKAEAAVSGVNVASRTQAQIISYLNQKGATTSDPVTYSTEPSYVEPYVLGALSTATQNSALAMVNQIRYIAGLPEVTLDTEYQQQMQAAALVNAANNQLDHYPTQPVGMSDELYNLGASGARRSNLSMGRRSLNLSILDGWMGDYTSASNLATLGHRRWVLNPRMGKTCFGSAGAYYSMYSFDNSGSSTATGVIWPAQQMPMEYFGINYPWSYSLGSTVNTSSVSVTLTKRGTGQTWNFSSSAADGHFAVNNDGYGQIGCIIFRPSNVTYAAGDIFDVTISGLSTPVQYSVEFFSIGGGGGGGSQPAGPLTLTNGSVRNDTLVANNALVYEFTAPSAGTYSFFSEGTVDTLGYLYNNSLMRDSDLITSDDDSGVDYNFKITQNLQSGQKVYLKVTGYGSASGSVNVWGCKNYTISFNTNGSSASQPDSITKLHGIAITLPGAVEAKEYTVNFNANGGSVSTASKIYSCTQTGWNLAADGSSDNYALNGTCSLNGNYTLYAKWTNPNATDLPTPTRTGYIFNGWYTAASGGTKITATSTITASTTLYAHWGTERSAIALAHATATSGTITNGAPVYYKFTAPSAGIYAFETIGSTDTFGELYSDSAYSTRIDDDDDGGENYNFRMTRTMTAGEIVYLVVKGYSSNTNGSYTLYARKVYTVHYDFNGGNAGPASSIKYSGTALTLSMLEPEKYYTVTADPCGGTMTESQVTLYAVFKNWNTKRDGSGTSYAPGASYTSNSDVTLYAQWQDVTVGTPPTPTKSGYTFAGWYTAASGGTKVSATTKVTGNMTIYAHWTAETTTYTISYNANGGSGAPASQTKTPAKTLKLTTAVPARDGYNFLGWATSKTAAAAQYQPGASFTTDANTTLYAVWERVMVTLTNGNAASGTLTSGSNDVYKFTAITPGAYSFFSRGSVDTYGVLYEDAALTTILVRNDNTGESGNFKINYTMQAGQTVYLKVRGVDAETTGNYTVRACSRYIVKYNANGGTGAPGNQEKFKGSSLALTAEVPVREGYTFLGWAATKTAAAPEYQPKDLFSVNADTTLYAVWIQAAVTITNGNAKTGTIVSGKYDIYKFTAASAGTYGFFSVGTVDTYGVLYDDMGLTTILARDDNSGENKNFKLTYDMAAGQTIYLKVRGVGTAAGDYTVRAGLKYTVKYSANGGTGAPSAQEKFKGYALTLTSAQPTKEGYVFMGWATSKTSSVIEYKAGAKFSVNADTTLYAVWGRESTALTNGVAATGTVTSGANTIYRFTAASAGEYSFYTRGSVDTYGALYEDATLSTVKLRDDNSGEGKNFRIDYTMTAGQTVYVKVRGVGTAEGDYTIKACRRYAVTFNANGGSGAPAAQEKFKGSGLTLTKEVPTRTGYTFLGWATSKSAAAAEYQPGGSFSVNEDTTLYAVWKKK